MREAWKALERSRNRDFERLKADEDMRRRHEEGPKGNGTRETGQGLKGDGWE